MTKLKNTFEASFNVKTAFHYKMHDTEFFTKL